MVQQDMIQWNELVYSRREARGLISLHLSMLDPA